MEDNRKQRKTGILPQGCNEQYNRTRQQAVLNVGRVGGKLLLSPMGTIICRNAMLGRRGTWAG